MAWWIWIVIAFALLGLELASTTLHVGFFAIGAFVVAILKGIGVELPLWGELLVFTITSVVAFLFIRPVVMKRLRLTETKVVDSLVGEIAVVMADLEPEGVGKAEMRGSTWNARNVGPERIARGERCVVDAVEGLVLYVKKGSTP
ncbi:MAG TPA: NfeD family protein [Thermoanaerobaculia bacterium]